MLTPTVLLAPEPALRPPAVATGGQVTVFGGWDSTPIPGASPAGGAAFSGVEAYGSLRLRERGGDTHEARLLGRAFVYPTLADAGANARASLLWSSAVRIHARARLTFSVLSSLGATRAARGTDGTPTPYEAASSQRTDGATRASLGFLHELTPRLRLSQTIGFGLGATVSDRFVGTGAARPAGIDFFGADVSTAFTHRASARTTWEYTVRLDRTRLLNIVDATTPTLRAADPVDLVSAAGSVRLGFLTTPTMTNWARVGVTVATTTPSTPASAANGGTRAVPTIAIGVSTRSEASSFMAEAGFGYSLVDPRLGPGAGTTGTVRWLGRPVRSLRNAQIMLTADAARTSILGGPNDGGTFLSLSGSTQLRVALAPWIGVVGGVELRHSRLDAPGGGTVFSREVVFVGLSSAWWSDLGAASPSTLAAPVQTGF